MTSHLVSLALELCGQSLVSCGQCDSCVDLLSQSCDCLSLYIGGGGKGIAINNPVKVLTVVIVLFRIASLSVRAGLSVFSE